MKMQYQHPRILNLIFYYTYFTLNKLKNVFEFLVDEDELLR